MPALAALCIVLFVWRIYLSVYVNAQNEKLSVYVNLQNEKFENLKSKMTECQNQNDYLRRSYDVSDLLLKEKLNEFDDMKLQIHECRNYHDYREYAKLAGALFICFTILLLGIRCYHGVPNFMARTLWNPGQHSLMSRDQPRPFNAKAVKAI